MGIYVLATIYLGIARQAANLSLIRFIANRFTGIGLVGTVLGIMLMMTDISSIGSSDINNIVTMLFEGMATVLITTLFGMASSLLLDTQVAFVFGVQANDESEN